MKARWLILISYMTFDGLASHYKSIFFSLPVREGNPFLVPLFQILGVWALAILIPAVIGGIWVLLKAVARVSMKYEQYADFERVCMNAMIIVYSPLIIYIAVQLLLQLAGSSFTISYPYGILAPIMIGSGVIYAVYEDLRRRKKPSTKTAGR